MTQENNPLPERPKSKTALLHETLLSGLPPSARRALLDSATEPQEGQDEADCEFQRFQADLPRSLRESLSKAKRSRRKPQRRRTSVKPLWCLCEQPDGDFPKVRLFKTSEGLARYMAKLEGEDVSVWPFYGVPLRFTKPDASGQRFLLLPGEEKALLLAARGPVDKIDADLLDLEDEEKKIQLDGWIGDPCLAEEAVGSYLQGDEENREIKERAKKKSKGREKRGKPKNEDDEGDETDGSPVEPE